MKLLNLFAFLLILTSCLGKLESMTDETKNEVKKSNTLIEKSPVTVLLDSFKNPNSVGGQQSSFVGLLRLKEATEALIYSSFGINRPFENDANRGYPNVTYVMSESVRRIKSPQVTRMTINETTLSAMEEGCLFVLEGVASRTLTAEENGDSATSYKKIINVCSSVLGALPADQDVSNWPELSKPEYIQERASKTVEAVDLIKKIQASSILQGDEDYKKRIDYVIQSKMTPRAEVPFMMGAVLRRR